MKHVLVFGTFDGVHKGHEYLFTQAKQLGDNLSVVIARDQTVLTVKKHKPKYSEKERFDFVKNNKSVDNVFLGNLDDKYKIIQQINPDIIALGYDQREFIDNLKQELEKRNLDINLIRLDSFKPQKYKSSILNNI